MAALRAKEAMVAPSEKVRQMLKQIAADVNQKILEKGADQVWEDLMFAAVAQLAEGKTTEQVNAIMRVFANMFKKPAPIFVEEGVVEGIKRFTQVA